MLTAHTQQLDRPVPTKPAPRHEMQQWAMSALCGGTTPQRANASVALWDSLNAGSPPTLLLFGGASNESGAPSQTLVSLDLSALGAGVSWRPLQTSGALPAARRGHSSFTHDDALWVFGGNGIGGTLLHDLHRLDLTSMTWQEVHQRGSVPDRALGKHSKSFGAATLWAAGHCMLAFGAEPQDENTSSSRPGASPALRLHAYGLRQQSWSQPIKCAGSITFSKLEALACVGDTLLAVGWTPSASGTKGDSGMQVCSLDLSGLAPGGGGGGSGSISTGSMAGRTPLQLGGARKMARSRSWQHLAVQGIIPSARTSAAAAVLGHSLLLHGGMLCGPTVAGCLSSDTFSLDLRSATWSRLTPLQERVVGSSSLNTPRAGHVAVAVPAAAAVMLIGGTNTRQAFAACDSIECLRLVVSDDASSASPLADAAVMQGVLSSTPALMALVPQPFGHVTRSPILGVQAPAAAAADSSAAATPAVHLSSAEAAPASAAGAAVPSSALAPSYDFSRFLGNDTLSDIELVAGGVRFPAHRLLLCALSPRLAQLIASQATAAGPGASGSVSARQGLECRWRLVLEDVYPDILGLMLKHMYGSLTAVPVEAAPLLFKAAERYGLAGLRSACLKMIIATLSLDNVCSSVLLAHDHNVSELAQACILYVAASPERFQQVLAGVGYLHLNSAHPRVGQMLVSAVTQQLMARRG